MKPEIWRSCWTPSDLRRPWVIIVSSSLDFVHGSETKRHVPLAGRQGPALQCSQFTFFFFVHLFIQKYLWSFFYVTMLNVELVSQNTNRNTADPWPQSHSLWGDRSIKIEFQGKVIHATAAEVAQIADQAYLRWRRGSRGEVWEQKRLHRGNDAGART